MCSDIKSSAAACCKMSGQDSLQINTNSNLMIKVCFPEELGPVKPEDLDVFLRAVQEVQSMGV